MRRLANKLTRCNKHRQLQWRKARTDKRLNDVAETSKRPSTAEAAALTAEAATAEATRPTRPARPTRAAAEAAGPAGATETRRRKAEGRGRQLRLREHHATQRCQESSSDDLNRKPHSDSKIKAGRKLN
jgi:hypothetical protein